MTEAGTAKAWIRGLNHHPVTRSHTSKRGVVQTLLAVFAFSCFFPYPAVLRLGGSTGLQLSHLFALLLLPILAVQGFAKRNLVVFGLLVIPNLSSAAHSLYSGQYVSAEIMMKWMVSMTLALLPLLPTSLLAKRGEIIWGRMLPVLSAAAWAIAIHASIGLYQFYSFSRGRFPFAGVFNNPSFPLEVAQIERILYIRRPFGLFPEPSAMAASIGPWVVLLVAMLLYRPLAANLGRSRRLLFTAASAAGITLIILSRSGFVLVLLGSILLLAVPFLRREMSRVARLRAKGVLVAGMALTSLALITITGFTILGSRLNLLNPSWIARGTSILLGFRLMLSDWGSAVFGVGPGQSHLLLQQRALEVAGVHIAAVWGSLARQLAETGLLGASALGVLLWVVGRRSSRSGAALYGATAFASWLVGLAVITSYLVLSPIWLFLGVLLLWDGLFAGADRRCVGTRVQSRGDPSGRPDIPICDQAR